MSCLLPAAAPISHRSPQAHRRLKPPPTHTGPESGIINPETPNSETQANNGNSPADIKCREGVMLYHGKKYSQAAEKYKEALALDHGHVGCLNAFALLLCETGNHQGCCELYQRALHFSPSSTDTLFNFAAYQQIKAKNLLLSEGMYVKALSIEPKQVNCLFNLAALYNEKKEYDTCLETYKRILRIKPDHVDSMCNSGQLLQSVFNVSCGVCSVARMRDVEGGARLLAC